MFWVFQKFLKEHNMHFFTTYNEETKASIVESFNRTLKTKMYFTHIETLTYVDVLFVRRQFCQMH
jgi:enoyl reductase-like protein